VYETSQVRDRHDVFQLGRSCLKIFQQLLSEDSDVDPPCDGRIEKLAFIF